MLFARQVITGAVPPPDAATALASAKQLKSENRFDLARRVLSIAAVAKDDPLFTKVRQQLANCTYKDEDVPMPHRYYEALKVLREDCGLETRGAETETLGLGGAVYKRLFAWGGQHAHLERTLGYYHAAWAKRPVDDGYAGINTAFALDLLASQELASADVPPNVPHKRFTEADQIRKALIEQLTAQGKPAHEPWWYYATLGEAALGLGLFEDAVSWLQKALACKPAQWELESTARQLATLTRIQQQRNPKYDGAAALEKGLGVSAQAISSLLLGKVGVALSGGGFRASLFHIGVLARLAELDVLRHVEVLSCVSGGSIIGAFYYLALKNRLE
ncbi:MAG TPA: tetratricopeptide repeat-containing protein, partial [Thermoanaerobaculia bacterium]|nr:tetratricopeptide repeat-containing protein [Thermoanaerobaculia bacterium]